MASRSEGRRAGFTLVEILIAVALVSLLAGALAPLAARQLQAGRRQATRERMDTLVRAMVGDERSDTFGYLGEMGGLPPTLADLNDPAGKPAYTVDPNDGVGYGYNGPYAPSASAPTDPVVDAWGLAYQYDPARAQIVSSGPDRILGNADDLTRPANPVPTTGNVVVTVMGLPRSGGPAEQLDASRASVVVAFSRNGVRNERMLTGAGPFVANGLHLGLHGLRATGSGSYAGAAPVRDVVRIRRGTTAATLVLVEP